MRLLRALLLVTALVTGALSVPRAQDAVVGAPLPAWSAGTLDIHHVSTGRGNATFVRMPGGATLLIDAGAAAAIPHAEAMPDESRSPGEWIARYILAMAPGVDAALDHVVLTHFHPDHIAGIGDVAERVAIRTLVDRGSDYLPPPADALLAGYKAFLSRHPRMRAEAAHVGSTTQIVDRAGAARATTRIVAANDLVWSGREGETTRRFPPIASIAEAEDRPTENMCSIALTISYGAFDYFTGGDMPGYPVPGGPAWHDLESGVARAIGRIDARQVGHHGSIEVENPYFAATLRSRVLVLPAWAPTHPSADVLKRLLSRRVYPEPRDVFVTQFREVTKAAIGARATQVASGNGHVVIRVAPGGAEYRVYVLDNRTEARAVLSVHGPYRAE